MANIYVDGDTGSDSNDGLTTGTAYLTISKAFTVTNNNDTIMVGGTVRHDIEPELTAKSGVTIQGYDNGNGNGKARISAASANSEWGNITANQYVQDAPFEPIFVLRNYGVAADSIAPAKSYHVRQYKTAMTQVADETVVGALAATEWSWHAIGNVYINADTTTDTYEMVLGYHGIILTSCTNIAVKDIDFYHFMASGAANDDFYAIRITGPVGTALVSGCDFYHGGFHSVGIVSDLTNCTQATIQNCVHYGGFDRRAGTSVNPFVIANTGGSSSFANAVFKNITIHVFPVLDISGADASVGGFSSTSFLALQTHGVTDVSDVTGIAVSGCKIYADYYTGAPNPEYIFLADSTDDLDENIPTDYTNLDDYSATITDSLYIGHGQDSSALGTITIVPAHCACVRTRFDLRSYADFGSVVTPAFAVGTTTAQGGGSNGYKARAYFEACEFVFAPVSLNGCLIGVMRDCQIYIGACTFYNVGTGAAGFLRVLADAQTPDPANGAKITIEGSIFSNNTDDKAFFRAPTWSMTDGVPTGATVAMTDNLYYNIQNASYIANITNWNTRAEFTAAIDPDGVYLTDPGFATVGTTEFGAAVGGYIDLNKKILPSLQAKNIYGINGLPYDGTYGANQYGSAGGVGGIGEPAGAGARIDHFQHLSHLF